jgi:hypothetical protein
MYCSNCGQQLADHLNYCNSCGARLEKTSAATPGAASPHFVKGLSVVLMMGFIGFVAVLKIVLDNARLDMPATVFILVAYLAALTSIAAMYFGYMWKSSGLGRDRSKRHGAATEDYAPPSSFRGSNTNQLGEPTYQPVGSVTDKTTRTLDEAMAERR